MRKNISTLTKSGFRSIRRHSSLAIPAACAMFLMLPVQPAQSLEPKWPAGPYRYLVVDQDVRDILAAFGRNLNVTVKMSDQVGGRRIRGRLPVTTAKEFLARLCDSYGLVWYYDGAVLHISAENEVRTELVDLGNISPNTITDKLQALGISDPRYAIRSTGDTRVLSVSGPPSYLSAIRQTVLAMQKAATPRNVREVHDGDDIKVRVFRGKQGS